MIQDAQNLDSAPTSYDLALVCPAGGPWAHYILAVAKSTGIAHSGIQNHVIMQMYLHKSHSHPRACAFEVASPD